MDLNTEGRAQSSRSAKGARIKEDYSIIRASSMVFAGLQQPRVPVIWLFWIVL
jgi:hypothetical protein